MNLCSTQECFANALIAHDAQAAELFGRTLRSNPRIPEQLAVEIYRNNTQGVRVKALQAVYPVFEQIVGEQCFFRLAHDYVRNHPSKYSDLNVYGESFSDFVRQVMRERDAFVELPYLYDLVRLEWFFNAAYYAYSDVNNVAGLHAVEGQMVLKTSHALSLLQSAYPVHAIWKAHKTNINLSEIEALAEIDCLVIYRNGFKPTIEQVDIEDWQLLIEITKTMTIEALAEYSIRMKLSLDKRLPRLMKRGWVIVA